MAEANYSVYLIERHGEQGGKREVTSPVQGNEVEFYESGVWLNREKGRNFFPYEQIRTIREHADGSERESDRADEPAGETETPRGDPESEMEGDPGAEEDMLEE